MKCDFCDAEATHLGVKDWGNLIFPVLRNTCCRCSFGIGIGNPDPSHKDCLDYIKECHEFAKRVDELKANFPFGTQEINSPSLSPLA